MIFHNLLMLFHQHFVVSHNLFMISFKFSHFFLQFFGIIHFFSPFTLTKKIYTAQLQIQYFSLLEVANSFVCCEIAGTGNSVVD